MTTNFHLLFQEASKGKNEIIKLRRDFHQYPETGFQEERTSKIVANLLKEWGIEIEINVGKTGIVGFIEGRGKGNKTVALRADMDALTMQEKNDISYKSKVDGKMHACGHDGHTAMLLGAAKVLSKNREHINGNIKLIFQPAEEGPDAVAEEGTDIGGAYLMIEEGVLNDVDAIFGMHLTTAIPVGKIGIDIGPAMASVGCFEIKMIGKGGHTGSPHESIDAVAMGVRVFTEIEYMINRLDPLEPLAISIGTFKSGSVCNVIAEECEITGTIRTYSEDLEKMIINNIRNIANHVAKISGGSCEVNITPALPPLINDLKPAQFSIDIAKQVLGEKNVIILEKPSMGGEDFAYYLQRIPGAFMWLGAGNESRGFINPLHHPKFDFDEEALVFGTRMYIKFALNYLEKGFVNSV